MQNEDWPTSAPVDEHGWLSFLRVDFDPPGKQSIHIVKTVCVSSHARPLLPVFMLFFELLLLLLNMLGHSAFNHGGATYKTIQSQFVHRSGRR